jgi:lysophospholipid acyltransferase (LPLAT)-like uncharacterized protein
MEEPMKLRHPWLIKSAARLGTWGGRLWMGTLRFASCPVGPNIDPTCQQVDGHHLYAFWHEVILLPAFYYCRVPQVQVLISRSRDGLLIAEACRALGFEPVRGSTARGGVGALVHLLRSGQGRHVAVTPDGPRGPRRQVQMGIIYLAARTGMPIVPSGFAADRPWRLKSWDRFVIPRPWSRATCVMLPAITVPPDINREQMEGYRVSLEKEMLRATQMAEQWAETGVRPEPHDHSAAAAA